MDKKKPSRDERGNVRYLWVLVGAYLLYLAYQQAQLLWRGEATKPTDVAVCAVSGLVFAGVGAWVIFREWQAWRYAQAHKDDPETWGDPSEAETVEGADAAELPEASEDTDALSDVAQETDAETSEDADAAEVADAAESVGDEDEARKEETP